MTQFKEPARDCLIRGNIEAICILDTAAQDFRISRQLLFISVSAV